MATKKQRRRREKLQRHEYEYVTEDEEGEEIVLEAPRQAPAKRAAAKAGEVVDRRGRVIQKPTWQRVLKRSAIFAPILAILIWVTGGSLSTEGKIFNIVILLAIFIPFSYLVDSLIYRSVRKRQQRDGASQPPARR
jgi:hypothetical protein